MIGNDVSVFEVSAVRCVVPTKAGKQVSCEEFLNPPTRCSKPDVVITNFYCVSQYFIV